MISMTHAHDNQKVAVGASISLMLGAAFGVIAFLASHPSDSISGLDMQPVRPSTLCAALVSASSPEQLRAMAGLLAESSQAAATSHFASQAGKAFLGVPAVRVASTQKLPSVASRSQHVRMGPPVPLSMIDVRRAQTQTAELLSEWTQLADGRQRAAPSRRKLLANCALAAAAAGLIPQPASAKIDSTNPANNYYFPMAKYRYLPRIFRSWVAVDELAPQALAENNWEGLEEVWKRLDDTTTALPLYASAVEGSRSGKKKKKSDVQKVMLKDGKAYNVAVEKLEKAVAKKNIQAAAAALTDARANLLEYRQMAQIDKPDGGIVEIPVGNAAEAGHNGVPLGYVIPAFRGGGISNDYNYLPGQEMLRKGQVTDKFRASGLSDRREGGRDFEDIMKDAAKSAKAAKM